MSSLANIETNQKSLEDLVDSWLKSEQNGEHFPVPFDLAWKIAGYSNKGNAMRVLRNTKNGLVEGQDFLVTDGDVLLIKSDKSGLCGRSSDYVVLSCDAFKHFCLLAKTDQGKQIRQYFIEAESNWKLVKTHFPQVSEEVEILRLKLDLEKEINKGRELDRTMMQLHGDRVVLALRGLSDQIIEKEIVVTEVVDPLSSVSQKILTAEQLKRVVRERTGQKIKSMKEFTDSLRKAGRDDLLIPVTRHQTSEYPIPEKIDEAIAVVYGKSRQRLLGE